MSARQRSTSFETKKIPMTSREIRRAVIRAMKKDEKRGIPAVREILEQLSAKS